jgi:hypothetical protein
MRKKIAAILLLSVTLLASSHATLIMHFCSGNLNSLALAGFFATPDLCCCSENEVECADNEDVIGSMSCCANHFFSVNTDDYTVQQQLLLDNKQVKTLVFAIEDPLSYCYSENFTKNKPIFPPPDGLKRSGASIRHFCCSYLI